MATLLPVAAALLAVPFLLKGLGPDRFGCLTIVWAIIGYASFFDLGIGRVLTQMVAERLGRSEKQSGAADTHRLVWTALWLLFGLGILGTCFVWLAAPALVALISVPSLLSAEAVLAFRVLAWGLPFVFVSSALLGVLQAYQRFDVIAAVRVPLGLLTTAGPLLVLPFSSSIVGISALLLIVRVLGLIVCGWGLATLRLGLLRPRMLNSDLVQQLVVSGGWMTVSNVIGPLLTYLDRFFISGILGTAAVAWYVTPYEVLSRLSLIPAILLGVLFSAMSTAVTNDMTRALVLYRDAAAVLRKAMLAICVFVFLFSQELLTFWIDAAFATQTSSVTRWLVVGVWLNALAQLPFNFLQGTGRADLTAKTHLLELFPYLILLIYLTKSYGVNGAAAAWTARVLIDTLILNWLAGRRHEGLAPLVRLEIRWLAGGLIFLTFCSTLESIWLRVAFTFVVWACVAWQLFPDFLRAIKRR